MGFFSGLFGGGDSPKYPDPVVTANAQTKSNIDTAKANAQLNRINETTPFGNLTYTQAPNFNQAGFDAAMAAYTNSLPKPQTAATGPAQWFGRSDPATGGSTSSGFPAFGLKAPVAPNPQDYMGIPTWSKEISLSPDQQQILDTKEQSQIGMGSIANDNMDRLRAMLSSPLPSVDSSQALNAMMKLMEPQFAQDEEALRTRMINTGGADAVSNPAYFMNEFRRFDDAKNRARLNALLQAPQWAGQNIQNMNTKRGGFLNQMLALNGGDVSVPQFSPTAQVGMPNIDMAGLINNKYNAELADANAEAASGQNFLNGLFGLGAAGIMTI